MPEASRDQRMWECVDRIPYERISAVDAKFLIHGCVHLCEK